MTEKMTLVHVTHEAKTKVGGIGAVLHGFFTSPSYLNAVERSILVGPLFSTEGSPLDRLGEDGEVLYSSIDGLGDTGYADAFGRIENYYNVNIVYGRRTFCDKQTGVKSSPEVLLIDIRRMDIGPVNEFKKQLYAKFGIRSNLHEHLWEYEQYIRIALPAISAIKAIGAGGESTTVVAHEFMGMPTALAAMLDCSHNFKTAFYAHEVATMRHIVEKHPGHDTMFYNAIAKAHDSSLYLNNVFGDQSEFFKHSLVEASKHCDAICAVGDYVVDELKFIAPEFANANINIVYNGLPAYKTSLEEKLRSKARLMLYCENLLGYKPDFIFTHVARLVRSKGLWRDLRILYNIEKEFKTLGKTGVMFLLSTEMHQRRSSDIANMESNYNWPVAHRESWPDLSGGEAAFYAAIQEFNAKTANIKVVFINQFGFEQKLCGKRMPHDMEFMDIRRGSDVEFGLSIYEPFGIAQLESLTFGGICVLSSVCGCAGFARDASGGSEVKNIIVADYTDLNSLNHNFSSIAEATQIDHTLRSKIEDYVGQKVALQICSRLPRNDSEMENMINSGYSLAKEMSWDIVVNNYLLPCLQKAYPENINENICPQMSPSLN